MAFLGKVYKFDREENFDAFLKAIDIPDDQIQKYQSFKPSYQLLKDGDKYKYISTTEAGSKETLFVSGVEFDDLAHGDTAVKTTFSLDGNILTQTVKTSKGSAVFKREYNGDEMKVTVTSSAWDGVAYRYYKA